MEDLLELRYVPLSAARQWERNPKKHDEEAIRLSIVEHGFKDPPKYEPELNDGAGGIVEGNGRIQVLWDMRQNLHDPPRGIGVDEDGDWAVPILFGVDADSQHAAEAYAIDHNNLVLSGGDFDALDLAGLWETSEYVGVLDEIDDLGADIVSVDDNDLERIHSVVDYTEDGEPYIPDPDPPVEPTLESDYFVGIHCSSEALEKIAPVVEEWGQDPDVTVNIS